MKESSHDITGKKLRSLGFPEGPVIRITLDAITRKKDLSEAELISLLKKILNSPEEFLIDPDFKQVAQALIPPSPPIQLAAKPGAYPIFGKEHIDTDAIAQMNQASRLPITRSGALMPDAHPGYGLPIGGVLATENAVIPYGVGVDIGCRMCLSIFDLSPGLLKENTSYYTRELNEASLFGAGKQFSFFQDHEVLSRKEFDAIPFLRQLKDKAAYQLGTSGSGNHFVEFGEVIIQEKDSVLNVAPGKYIGLLTHSGSRGLGASIAKQYTQLAKAKRPLPAGMENLAWLTFDEEEGAEYWLAMNLAGDYASANHRIIHEKIARQLGQPIRVVENHHNFAWKEIHDGKEVIVHRKGATPAGADVLGIIPGSMTAPGFIVKGLGNPDSLRSASHGAGRQLSRSAALKTITKEDLKKHLDIHGVTLIGGGLDEAPFAYKNIQDVMRSQEELVDIVGRFTPRIVKMDDAVPFRRKNRKK